MGKTILANDGIDAVGKQMLEKAGFTVVTEKVAQDNLAKDDPESRCLPPGIPRTDPWDGNYEYLNFSANIPGIKGKIRKDHNLHPLNTEFDLYSKGPDGESVSPLTAAKSRDDILWARDGSFIGKAEDF